MSSSYIRWPGYLPLPDAPLSRSRRPVPNASSVNWPQSQFAPRYLPDGSPSFQPYVYPEETTLYGDMSEVGDKARTWVQEHPLGAMAIGIGGLILFGVLVTDK